MENNKSKSVWTSIMGMNCPRCREGQLFTKSSFEKPFDMSDRCEVCNQNFMPEPGFYFGAMFISYIIWGVFSIGLCLSLVFLFDWTVNGAFALLIFISVISFVWIFRVSRSIWIHINVRHKANWEN